MADSSIGYQLAQRGVSTLPTFNYRYPLTKLDSSDDYLKITVLSYIPPGFLPSEEGFALPSSDDVGYDKIIPKGTILLPITDTVQDNNTAQWGQSALNPIAAIAAGVGAGLFDTKSGQDFKNKITSTSAKIYGAAQSAVTQKFLQGSSIGLGLNVLLRDTNVGEIASRYSGVIANSNIELIFTGVNLRDPFTFTFDIVPRSQKEAIEVKNIIKIFKKHSAAKKGRSGENASGLFLKAPEVFKLEYMSGGKPHPYLNKFKICALNNMAVNYTGSGTYATYSDSTPINMQLSLAFQELTPIYYEDYDTPTGQQGTGY